MRTVCLLLLLLLAGCSAPAPPEAGPADVPAETLTQHAVEDSILSPVAVCPPAAGHCAGVSGSDTASFAGQTWVALDVTVVPADDFPPNRVLGPLSKIRVVAFCLGERLTCPQQALASAEGDFPIRLHAEGFRVADPDMLAFRVEHLGPLPLEGSGASYTLAGTLVSADSPSSVADA